MTKTTWLAIIACTFTCVASHAQQGLVGEYFNGTNFQEKKCLAPMRAFILSGTMWLPRPVSPLMNFPPAGNAGSKRLKAATTFSGRTFIDDGIRVKVGNQMVINAWECTTPNHFSAPSTWKRDVCTTFRWNISTACWKGKFSCTGNCPVKNPSSAALSGTTTNRSTANIIINRNRQSPQFQNSKHL